MRNFQNIGHDHGLSEVVHERVKEDPMLVEKQKNHTYAGLSFFVSLMFTGVAVASMTLSRPPSSQRIARDFAFNVTANKTQIVDCPVSGDFVNVSAAVQACQMIASYCVNASLPEVFQFIINATCNDSLVANSQMEECQITPQVNATGRCLGSDVRGTDYTSDALFFMMGLVFLAGSIAYLVRAAKVAIPTADSRSGTSSPVGQAYGEIALNVQSAAALLTPVAPVDHRNSFVNWGRYAAMFSVVRKGDRADTDVRLLSDAPTPSYGIAPREE